MELTELENKMIESFTGTPEELNEALQAVEGEKAIFPFNRFEHLVCILIGKGGLTYEQYKEIKRDYIGGNPYLEEFQNSAPRGFGEKFAQEYIRRKCPNLKDPSKESDPEYDSEYDFWLDGIKIEVKASRAVDSDSTEPLYMKALSRDTQKKFLMNFQQLKPQCCDVFVWLAMFRDEIVIWVMSSSEVKEHPLFSGGQHRGNSGNEGQLPIRHHTIHQLDEYILQHHDDLETAIREAAERK